MLYGLKLDKIDEYVASKESGIKSLREQLAKNAVSDEWKFNRTEELNSLVQEIGRAEAEHRILATLAHALALESKPTHQEIYTSLLRDVLSGPDDGWSGRGNDLRRAIYDAKLRLIQDLAYVLDVER